MQEIPIQRNPEFLAESKNFIVYKLADGDKVLKMRKSFLEKQSDESVEEYAERRQQDAVGYIQEKRMNEDELIKLINQYAPEVVIPPHEWLIVKGNDGYPTVAKVQEYIKGSPIKEYGIENLSSEQVRVLATLMKASIECMFQFGRHIDLVGSDIYEPNSDSLYTKFIAHALTRSVNIFVRDDGSLCLIDIQKGKKGKTLNIAKLIKYVLDNQISST